MKKQLSINNIGTSGLNTDVAPWELPPTFITEGFNFRVDNKSISSAGGHYTIVTSASPTGECSYLQAIKGTSDKWLAASNNGIFLYDGTTWVDITDPSFIPFVGQFPWQGGMIGKIPYVNNVAASPYTLVPDSNTYVMELMQFSPTETWADRGLSCKVMRTHKNFLFALNLSESSSDWGDTYRWSHPADINGLPYTWDETDLSALAGIAALGGDGGEIVDGLSLRDSFVIYSESAIDILDFTGGEFVWRRRELSNNIGLLSVNCVVEVHGRHYFIGNEGIYVNDGTSVTPLLTNRMQSYFDRILNQNSKNRSFVCDNSVYNEIWFCISSQADEFPNTAFVYNWTADTWSVILLPKNTVFAAVGSELKPEVTWEAIDELWGNTDRYWGGGTGDTNTVSLHGLSIDGLFRQIDHPSGIKDDPVECVVGRTDLPVDGHDNAVTVTRVYPHMEGGGEINMKIGAQDFSNAPVRWDPILTFTPTTQRKLDVRCTGTHFVWSIRSNSKASWRISGMLLEYSTAGKR